MLLPFRKPGAWPQGPFSRSENGRIKRQQETIRSGRGSGRVKINAQAIEIRNPRNSKKKYARRYKVTKERIVRFWDKFEKVFREHQEGLEKREQRIRGMEAELSHTKELLAARTTELAGAQSVLAAEDSKSEVGVFISDKTIELLGTGVCLLHHLWSCRRVERLLTVRLGLSGLRESDASFPSLGTRKGLWGFPFRGCAPQDLKPQTDSDLGPRQASGCRHPTPN